MWKLPRKTDGSRPRGNVNGTLTVRGMRSPLWLAAIVALLVVGSVFGASSGAASAYGSYPLPAECVEPCDPIPSESPSPSFSDSPSPDVSDSSTASPSPESSQVPTLPLDATEGPLSEGWAVERDWAVVLAAGVLVFLVSLHVLGGWGK